MKTGANAIEPGDLVILTKSHSNLYVVSPTISPIGTDDDFKFSGARTQISDEVGIAVAAIHTSFKFGGCYVVWSTCVGWCWDDMVEIDARLKEWQR